MNATQAEICSGFRDRPELSLLVLLRDTECVAGTLASPTTVLTKLIVRFIEYVGIGKQMEYNKRRMREDFWP
jgi:hypothetical protein